MMRKEKADGKHKEWRNNTEVFSTLAQVENQKIFIAAAALRSEWCFSVVMEFLSRWIS